MPGCKNTLLFYFMFFFRWRMFFVFSAFSYICQISGLLSLEFPRSFLIHSFCSIAEPSLSSTGNPTTKYSEKLTIQIRKKIPFPFCYRLDVKIHLLREIILLRKIGKDFKAESLLKILFSANQKRSSVEVYSFWDKIWYGKCFHVPLPSICEAVFKSICLMHMPMKYMQNDPGSNCKYTVEVAGSKLHNFLHDLFNFSSSVLNKEKKKKKFKYFIALTLKQKSVWKWLCRVRPVKRLK